MRYEDLTPYQRGRVDQVLGDGSNDMVHEAREGLRDDWTLARREEHMAKQAREIWEAIASDVALHLKTYEDIEADDELMKDLAMSHERRFVLAAELGWENA